MNDPQSDILSLETTAQELLATRGHLQAVLDAIPGCVSWITSDLKYAGINKYLSEVLGISAEAAVGKDVGFKATDPAFCEFVKEFFTSPSLKASTETTAMIHGKECHFLIVGQKYRNGKEAVFVGIDVTKRIEAEKERAMLEEQLLNTLLDGVITVNRDGVILALNSTAETLLDVPPGKAIGTKLSDACAEERKTIADLTEESLIAGNIIRELPVTFQASARVWTYTMSVTPLTGSADERALVVIRDISRLRDLEREASERFVFKNIIGKSPIMNRIFELIRNLADTDITALIQGPSGTGKELIAEALHYHGSTRSGPLIKVNCAALPETLLESELFGHVRGAFTGATRDKIGRFEQANGGTIFLDEIGDMSPALQQRLLRVLQEREIERVGSTKTIKIDIRVVAATNRDLAELVELGKFREDLFYRLNVVTVHLPALHERRDDIPLLIQHFIKRSQNRLNRVIKGITPDTTNILMNYNWPGNIRQLENAIEHAVVLSKDGFIRRENLPRELIESASPAQEIQTNRPSDLSKKTLQSTLESLGWNRSRAAKRLGISRTTLWKKIKEYGLSKPKY